VPPRHPQFWVGVCSAPPLLPKSLSIQQYCVLQPRTEFTPAWRGGGLPSKPSRLRLDPGKTSAGALLDPGAVARQLQDVRQAEVLSPPRVFEYDDDSLEPHHLQATGNLKASNQGVRLLEPLACLRKQGSAGGKAGCAHMWLHYDKCVCVYSWCRNLHVTACVHAALAT
jgi:hypothetical protein